MSKKQQVINTVLSQSEPFYSSTITSLSGASIALVSNTLNELLVQGKLYSKKDGKKTMYTLNDINNNQQINVTTEPLCSVAEKFGYIRNLVDMVIKGIQPSIMITGQPGVGKSYIVRDQLKNANMQPNFDYIQVTGHSSPFGLYKLLHDHRDATIVFDDTDSIFCNDVSSNILKAALDSYDKRVVSWYSDRAEQQQLDPYFEFKGRIIFISNMYLDKIDSAVRSRAFCFNLKMTNEEISEHMQNILSGIEPNISFDIKQDALDYLKTIHNSFQNYNIRTLIQSIRIRNYCIGTDRDWKKMINILTQDV